MKSFLVKGFYLKFVKNVKCILIKLINAASLYQISEENNDSSKLSYSEFDSPGSANM